MSIFESVTDKTDTLASAPIPARVKKGVRVAIITGNHVQDLEFFYPYYRLNEAGYDVDVITVKGGKLEGEFGLGIQETSAITAARAGDYALLYLPGGKAPADLRRNEDVISFVQEFAARGRPIAAICHGPQILITAELVRGKQMACFHEVREELVKAGGIYVNEALVEDGQFITARQPGDLPRHLAGVLDALEGILDLTVQRNERKSA